ncbi:MAG TPA: hypothetical protein PK788_03210 [Gemmatimonadaceae bacterium]|nr:hypothetical protein [Gemmatimonadaceae bacterium]HRQ77241.1 hypothetical protein [Gemmatimonadaceae bacterium]
MPYRNLFIIRIALMTGVFLFAGIAYFGPRFGMAPALGLGESLEALRYALWGFLAIAVGGALLLRTKLEGAAPDRLSQYLIIGWALGESAALMGIILYMGGAGLGPLSLGLMGFVSTLVLLPIPRPRR